MDANTVLININCCLFYTWSILNEHGSSSSYSPVSLIKTNSILYCPSMCGQIFLELSVEFCANHDRGVRVGRGGEFHVRVDVLLNPSPQLLTVDLLSYSKSHFLIYVISSLSVFSSFGKILVHSVCDCQIDGFHIVRLFDEFKLFYLLISFMLVLAVLHIWIRLACIIVMCLYFLN